MMFSIIVPVYNAEKYLRPCLDSIMAQTCCDWECICVDDGSVDSSRAILEEYAGRDRRIRVIHQVNAGPGPARNRALDIAHGEWLLFVDADDLVAPHMLQTILEMEQGADIVRVGLKRFVSEAEFFDLAEKSKGHKWYDVKPFKNQSYQLYMDGWQQFAYRRGIVAELRIKPYLLGEDNVFKQEYFARAKTIVWSDVLAYGYRTNPNSLTHLKFTKDILLGSMNWRLDCYRAMRESGKKIDRKIILQNAIFWQELLPVRAAKLKREDSDEVYEMWYACIPDFLAFGNVGWRGVLLRLILKYRDYKWLSLSLAKIPSSIRSLISTILGKGALISLILYRVNSCYE